MPIAVHQVLATLGYGDAIGHEVLGIQRVLLGAGYESSIFVQSADPRVEDATCDYRDLLDASHPDNILIHHFSIGSRASRVAYALPDRMALVYHNITPPEYFVDVNKELVQLCFRGRRELALYRSRCDLALGDSEYNRQELEAIGFPVTDVLPVVPGFDHLDGAADYMYAGAFDDDWVNVLFVGRMIPNKRIEDVIRIFHAYKKWFNPRSRLLLVGAHSGFERYLTMLYRFVARVGATDVHFIGHVSNEELTAYYEIADVFLCASEHEGFCVPLVESFHMGVPVLAYAATAVPATMDGAGVLYTQKDPLEVAALINAVADDRELSDRIVQGQVRSSRSARTQGLWRHAARICRSTAGCSPCPASAGRVRFLGPGGPGRGPGRNQAVPSVGISRTAGRRFHRFHRSQGTSMTVNQWVPAAHRGDAIGDSARRVRGLIRELGHESEIYALTIDDDLRDEVYPFTDPASRRGDVTIFHFALVSPLTAEFARLPRGRVLQYHNVTPAHFFAPYDAGIFRLAMLGREDLKTLVGHTDMALGDSEYNRQELEALGFGKTGVFPIAIDTDRIRNAPRRPALEQTLQQDGWFNFLFVGRIVPNKKIEDHIKLAEHYKRYVDEQYRFVFVGKTDATPRYYQTIRALLAEYRMPPGRFLFAGAVPDVDLSAYYRTARVYISLSEHEGFCVPLLEAMAADVPVMAYSSTAVPDTLGGAGVQFAPKDLEYAAELLGELAYNEGLRAQIIEGQRRRLADFGEARIRRDLQTLLGLTA